MLEPCLLGLLAHGEAYGYQLSTRLATLGIGPVPGGSLYPALLRLEKRGLLDAQWRAGDGGPGRKYYVLTTEGRRALGRQAAAWDTFAQAVSSVLQSGTSAVTGDRAPVRR
ncbi:MAG: PadR family transcriptional regulator [Actinomycetota bacterium]